MFERLLLKTIGTRLSIGGDCPYDPHCIYAGHGSCMATKEDLKGKEAEIIARIKDEEPHCAVAYLTLDPNKEWPCAASTVYFVVIPEDLLEVVEIA